MTQSSPLRPFDDIRNSSHPSENAATFSTSAKRIGAPITPDPSPDRPKRRKWMKELTSTDDDIDDPATPSRIRAPRPHDRIPYDGDEVVIKDAVALRPVKHVFQRGLEGRILQRALGTVDDGRRRWKASHCASKLQASSREML
jgi:hypothetical protein